MKASWVTDSTDYYLLYCFCVSHSFIALHTTIFWKKVCLQLPASPPHFALFFETNAIDQQKSFLKLAERYEPIKTLLLRLNMAGKENWFVLDLYPLAFCCNSLFVTFHYRKLFFLLFISFCRFCFWYPKRMIIIFPVFILNIILYIEFCNQLNLANSFFSQRNLSQLCPDWFVSYV